MINIFKRFSSNVELKLIKSFGRTFKQQSKAKLHHLTLNVLRSIPNELLVIAKAFNRTNIPWIDIPV